MIAARRISVLSRNAKVLLEAAGYNVVIVTELCLQQRFLAHLIAFSGNADVRYIRFKIAIKPVVSLADVEAFCALEIREFRRQNIRHPKKTHLHGEIWVATTGGRIKSYEILSDMIREIFPATNVPVAFMEGPSA